MSKVVIVFISLMLDLFFNLSQDDEVVSASDIKGVWVPDIDRSFQEEGDIYYPCEWQKSLYLHLKQIFR